jgi:hypothetical protein
MGKSRYLPCDRWWGSERRTENDECSETGVLFVVWFGATLHAVYEYQFNAHFMRTFVNITFETQHFLFQ